MSPARISLTSQERMPLQHCNWSMVLIVREQWGRMAATSSQNAGSMGTDSRTPGMPFGRPRTVRSVW